MKFRQQNLILIAGILIQLSYLPMLLAHRSVPAVILASYSPAYAAFLGCAVLSLLTFILLWLFRHPFYKHLARIPSPLLFAFFLGLGLLVLAVNSLEFEDLFKQYVTLAWVLFAAVCLVTDEGQIQNTRYWYLALVALIAFMLFFLFVNALTGRPYSPDEALWADLASSLRTNASLNARTGYGTHFAIHPGIGWINAFYGSIQWLFDWDLRVGRIFNFVGYCLGILGIGGVTYLLYGRLASLITLTISIVSGLFFLVLDYRPDHFLVIIQSFSFLAVIFTWKNPSLGKASLSHFLAGLIVTLGMQVHAAAITFVLGLSFFYLGQFLYQVWQSKKLEQKAIFPILALGIGMMLGTGIYYYANILPVGGLTVFLEYLVSSRGISQRYFDYLTHWTMLEALILVSAFIFVLWRRKPHDQRYLALVACVMLGIFIGDSQGYIMPYRGLFLPFLGTFLLDFFYELGKNRRLLYILTIVFLAFSFQALRIGFSGLGQFWYARGIPEAPIEIIGRDVLEQLQAADEVVVGTHELIWVLADRATFYSPMAEGITIKEFAWSPTEVWERLNPDVYIEILGRLETPVGLQAYLDRENFVRCANFVSYGYTIHIYRRTCE